MQQRPIPLFANDRNAAALLDMKLTDFRGLVEDGVLPKPTVIGGHKRWDVEQLKTIARGGAFDGLGEVRW